MSMIIFAGRGEGKTTNSAKLLQYYGYSSIIEEWEPGDELPTDTIAFTSTQCDGSVHLKNALNPIPYCDTPSQDDDLCIACGS